MNTIKLTEEELRNIGEYEAENYFDGFIFDEYRIIIKFEDCKTIYKVNFKDDVNKVTYRIIKGTGYKDYEFSFVEDREHLVCIDSDDKTIGGIIFGDETNKIRVSQDGDAELNKIMVLVASNIRLIKQYIMNESYKREVIQKEVEDRPNNCYKYNKKNDNNCKGAITYLLTDIIRYVSNNRHKMNITCECWSVRGHFRHYKNGKITWISPYEKGSKRNSGVNIKGKVYMI